MKTTEVSKGILTHYSSTDVAGKLNCHGKLSANQIHPLSIAIELRKRAPLVP